MEKTLQELRGEIDACDRVLVETLCRRMAVSREIGVWKQARSLPVRDPAREEELLNRLASQAGGFAPQIREIYAAVLAASRGLQEEKEHAVD